MLISELMLEKNIYIKANEKEKQKILDIFCKHNSSLLPVIQDGKILGILNLYHFIQEYDKNKTVKNMTETNIIAAHENDDLCSYKTLTQRILPVIDNQGLYLGFVRAEDLKVYLEIENCKREIKEKYDYEIQYYKDLKEEYDAIFESSYDGIYITDGNGITLGLNKACERIEGISAEDVIGKHMQELVDAGIYSESVTLKVLKQKKPVTILQKVKNGKEIIATGNPIFKNGQIIKVVTNSRDITELNQLKKQLYETQKLTKKYESELELLRGEQMKIDDIVIHSEKMKKIISMVIHVAKVDSTVLIQGETGVGKEVIVKLLHRYSKRREGAFIRINCGAIPETLLESELFGYEKGAFTGASSSGKIGLIELANDGTLFLDEIGELPLSLQVKLLRMVQDREIFRIGGKKQIPVNVRIIAATNRQLSKMVEEKTFREDLYYRLNVVPIQIPPLRERIDDIYPLITHFLNIFNDKYQLQKKISTKAMETLMKFNWPGNVRELENVVERLVVTTSSDTIEYDDLPEVIKNYRMHGNDIFNLNELLPYKAAIEHFEKNLLLNVIAQSKDTQEMANILRVDRSTITRKLKKHKIKVPF